MPKRKTTIEMPESILTADALESALSKTQPIVRQFIDALIEENRKAQTEIIKMKAEKISQDNRMKAVEKRAATAETRLYEIQNTPPTFEELLKLQAEHPERDVMISISDPIKPGKRKSGGRP